MEVDLAGAVRPGGAALRGRSPDPVERGEASPAGDHDAREGGADRSVHRRRAPRPGLRSRTPSDARADRRIDRQRRGSGARHPNRRVGEARDRALRGSTETSPRSAIASTSSGVAEPVIQKQGESRIVVQLPGVQDTARAKEILGRHPRRWSFAWSTASPRRRSRGGAHSGNGEALPRTQRPTDPPPAQRHAHGGVHHGRGVWDRSAKRLAGGIHHPRRQGRQTLFEPHRGQDRPGHGRRVYRAQVVHRVRRRRARGAGRRSSRK